MLDSEYKQIIKRIIEAYNKNGLIWKFESGKHFGESHLRRRQRRKEISEDWTLGDYNTLILNIINGIENNVHLYYLEGIKQRDFVFDDGP